VSFIDDNLTCVRGDIKTRSVSINNAASSKSRLHIHEMQRNVTNNYRELVVNKFHDSVLLLDGCAFCGGRESSEHEQEPCRLLTAAVVVHNAHMKTLMDMN